MLRRIFKRALEALKIIVKQELAWLETRRYLRKRAVRWQI